VGYFRDITIAKGMILRRAKSCEAYKAEKRQIKLQLNNMNDIDHEWAWEWMEVNTERM
jgi:hypothetical protein